MRAEDNATKKESPTSSRFRVRKEGSWREDDVCARWPVAAQSKKGAHTGGRPVEVRRVKWLDQ